MKKKGTERERREKSHFSVVETAALPFFSVTLLLLQKKKGKKGKQKREALSFLFFLLPLPAMSLAFDEYGRPFIIIRVSWRGVKERAEREEREKG